MQYIVIIAQNNILIFFLAWQKKKEVYQPNKILNLSSFEKQKEYDLALKKNQKNRNYWKYLKTKLKGENREVVSGTNQLKLLATDDKRRLADVHYYDGVLLLAKSFPNAKAMRFVEWFTNSDDTIDGKSKSKACALFESSLIDSIEVVTVKGL